jgi:Replication protein A C terminal
MKRYKLQLQDIMSDSDSASVKDKTEDQLEMPSPVMDIKLTVVVEPSDQGTHPTSAPGHTCDLNGPPDLKRKKLAENEDMEASKKQQQQLINPKLSPGAVDKKEVKKSVMELVQDVSNRVEIGLYVFDAIEHFGGHFTEVQIWDAIYDLCAEGHVYSTVDDDHFKFAM